MLVILGAYDSRKRSDNPKHKTWRNLVIISVLLDNNPTCTKGTDGSGHIERHGKINILFFIQYVRHQKILMFNLLYKILNTNS